MSDLQAPFPYFGKANRHRERLYFSPHCLTADGLSLFDAEKGGAR